MLNSPSHQTQDHGSKSQAQARADQIRAFRAESDLLAQAGLLSLTEENRQHINTYHQQVLDDLRRHQDVDLSEGARHLSLGMQIVSFLGASALATSLFFLFYQYWGYFSTTQQVVLLTLAPLLSFGLALATRRFDTSGYYAKLIGLISFAALVLQINMLGSIFNMAPSPNAFALFAIYGFLLAYLLQVRLLLAAAMASTFAFIGAHLGTWMGGYWIYFGEKPEHFFLPALLLFAVPLVFTQHRYHGFASIYQILSSIAFFIAVLILANWGGASYLPWERKPIEGFYQVIGFGFAALLILYGLRAGRPYLMLTGNVFFALFLFTKFFDWWWDWLPKYLFFLLIGLTAILAMMVFNRLRKLQQGGHLS
ncbi:DUF2157 domain-containing protein [Cellvibrio japonicus]|uniref:DUF2157 domain-containing protein n=1 Tax=Cellvibrio japonicus TaxID=155077 RepID=UPI0002E9FEF3|nr:DUF2157 domain-containing protein [Cellvibrio japonicus]QEI13760.1 DUF2157 domain-containing protein [Cellvibrio japonicus]QEI17334.1 DUF2157 domain-containing protein [Cellvibrio japonicus]QEI20911.1 DUF2157 domain-containing protein [Cellvibrio japonicus]